jgi:hypothetical protein
MGYRREMTREQAGDGLLGFLKIINSSGSLPGKIGHEELVLNKLYESI